MRKYIVCISTIFIVLCYIHMISSIAPFSIGEVTENTIYVNPHMDCIILVIPVFFFTGAFMGVLKKVYVRGSIPLGVISALLMFLYAENMFNLCFIIIAVFCISLVVYIGIEKKSEIKEKKGFFATITLDMTTKKKIVFAVVWMCICVVCLVYVISPKKWVCLYYDSNYSRDESWEMNNDVLVMGEEVANIGTVIGCVMNFNYNTGWKFYSNNSGDTQVSLTYKSVIDNDEEFKKVWDIYVDENMYVHHNMDYSYYVDVYIVYIILAVISTGLSLAFLLSGVKDILKNKKQRKIVNGAQ